MQTRFLCITVSLLLLLSTPAIPQNPSGSGPAFTGFYWATEVTDLGEQVLLRLTVELFNHTDADVVGGTLTVEHPLRLPDEPLAVFFTKIDVRTTEHVRVSEQFALPRVEFEQWQKGLGPLLQLDYRDMAGEDLQQHVPVVLMPLPEED